MYVYYQWSVFQPAMFDDTGGYILWFSVEIPEKTNMTLAHQCRWDVSSKGLETSKIGVGC